MTKQYMRKQYKKAVRVSIRNTYLMSSAGTSPVQLNRRDDEGQGRGTKVERIEGNVHGDHVSL